MNLNQNIATIRKDVKDEIIEVLEDATAVNEDLEDVKKVAYSERIESASIDLPMIWVLPEPHTPEIVSVRQEEHGFTFFFVALVRNIDVEVGKEEAEDIAARVYDHLMKDRQLNGKVHDIRPGLFNPAYQRSDSRQIYWAACQLIFIVRRITN